MSHLIRLNPPAPSAAERLRDQRFEERLARDRMVTWLHSDRSVMMVTLLLYLIVTPIVFAFAADAQEFNHYLTIFVAWLLTSIFHGPFLMWLYLPLGWGLVALLRWRVGPPD